MIHVSDEHHGTHDKHEAYGRLVGRLRALASDVERLTRGLDEEALTTRTVPDKWSLKELVAHLWRVQQLFEGRIDAVLTEDTPAIDHYTPDGDERFDAMLTRPAADLIGDFLADRERFAERLDGLSAAEWHRAGHHPEFPRYDVHFQVEYMGHHEAHHLYQLFQRRLPLGKIPN